MRHRNPLLSVAFILLLIVTTGCSNALIKSGDREMENLSYSKAIRKYEKALRGQPDNPELKLKLANAHRILNDAPAAEKYYTEVADTIELPMQEKLHYAQVLMKNDKYDLAIPYLEEYLNAHPDDELAKDLLLSTRRAPEMKEDTMAYELKPLPLDFLVSMFSPVAYGNGFVFPAETEIVRAASTNPWTGYSFLDLYYIDRDNQGHWNIPRDFSTVLNGPFHDGPATFNSDQTEIIYTRSTMRTEKKRLVNEENENQFSLYRSVKVDGEWQEPTQLPFNSIHYSVGHPALSPDDQVLYFSSDMPGGFGGSDLYKSVRQGDGWSAPINLGSTINTPGNEVFPYVSPSGKLYFSSEGHITFGGLDVFVSELQGDLWTTPKNLAYPLNSSRDDFGIWIDKGDTTGLVSSDRSGVDMIYTFAKINPIFVLHGMAKLKASQLPIEDVHITLINFTDGDTAYVRTGEDGKFTFHLLPNKKYKVIGEKEGYFTLSEEFATGQAGLEKDIDFSFEIDEIVESESGTGSGKSGDGTGIAAKVYDIGEIFYDFAKADIRMSEQPALDKLARLLKDNPGVTIEVQAHCDSRGTHAFNQGLSERRAASAVEYLVGQGVERARLKAKGFGETRPVNECVDGVECSPEQHQQNRRAEFIVLSGK